MNRFTRILVNFNHKRASSFFTGLFMRRLAYTYNNKYSSLQPRAMNGTNLRLDPTTALVDEVIRIEVQGLKPHQEITVAAITEENGNAFTSHAHYTADHKGCVDFAKDQSHGGTYKGQEPMGLFWSMEPSSGTKDGVRLWKHDVTTPMEFTVSVKEKHVRADSKEAHYRDDNVLSQVKVQRWYMGKGVRRIRVGEGSVRGTLFLPPGDGPFPGVIDIFGLARGLQETRAALLASRGFAAFALAYFDYEDLPKIKDGILPLEYLDEAVSYFCKHSAVLNGGIGVIGLSRGGEIALLTTTLSKEVKACVAINMGIFATVGQLSFRGKLLPRTIPDRKKFFMEDGAINISASWPSPNYLLPMEKATSTSFLLIRAGDDQIAPNTHTQHLPGYLAKCGISNYEAICYEGASHFIEPPYGPMCKRIYDPNFGGVLVVGGTPRDHAIAQEDSWRRILQFFRAHLPRRDEHQMCTSNM